MVKKNGRSRSSSGETEADEKFTENCPYCDFEITKKLPKRRSSFKCKACKRKVHVEPEQFPHPKYLLTEQEDEYTAFLRYAIGRNDIPISRARFNKARSALRKQFREEPSVNDVTWRLLNQALSVLARKRGTDGVLSYNDVVDFMIEFQEIENNYREKPKKITRPKKRSMPSIEEDLALRGIGTSSPRKKRKGGKRKPSGCMQLFSFVLLALLLYYWATR